MLFCISQDLKETGLHLAVRMSDKTSLALVDFLAQNCGCLEKKTVEGNTALHYCALYKKTECLKLLLKAKAVLHTVNSAGETALDIAKRLQHMQCIELLELAHSGKFNSQIHVEYTWEMPQDMYDSEDDLDERASPHPKVSRSPLPPTGVNGHCSSAWNLNKSCPARTYENIDFLYRNPPNNSAPTGGHMPPPLPAKAIQRETHTPYRQSSHPTGCFQKISTTPPEPCGPTPARSHSTGPSKGQRQTVFWEGQPFSGAEGKNHSTSPQSQRGPVSSEKTTSYRRTSGGSQGKGSAPSPGYAGSQEELYCSPASNPAPPPANANNSVAVPVLLPPPRSRKNAMISLRERPKKVKALVDCRAVGANHLAFFKNEVIIVTATDDPHWWVGHIEGEPSRSGTFPVNYVHKLGE